MSNTIKSQPMPRNDRERRLLALGDELAEAAVASDPDRGSRAMKAMILEFGPEVFQVFAEGLIDAVFTKLAERLRAGDLTAYATLARLATTPNHG
jgi:hypothetical protein